MVVTHSMLDTPLELPNIAAPILASMNSTAMALAIRPLPSIDIPCVESVNPNPIPQSLSVLATVPTPFRPCLYSITIIFLINPIAFIPSTHMVVINPTTRAPPFMKFPLVNIPITVNSHPRTRHQPFLRLGFRSNRPTNIGNSLRRSRR